MRPVLFVISLFYPLVTAPLSTGGHRASLRGGEDKLAILDNLDKSAGNYQSTIEKQIVVSGEKLNDETCAAFKQQGDLRVKELNEATKFIDDTMADLSKKSVSFRAAMLNAKKQLGVAAQAESATKSTSVKVDAMAHVDAILGTLKVADELDPTSWQIIVDALEQIENEKLTELEVNLNEALNSRSNTVNQIREIFSDPNLASIEFCVQGDAKHPEHQAPQPTNPVKVAKTLQDVTASAVSVLHHTGRMVQVKDDLKIETKLLDILDSLEKNLEIQAKTIMTNAFNGVSDIIAKVLSSDFKDDKFPEFAARKAELVAAEKTLKDSQTVEIADSKAGAALADKVIKLSLVYESDLGKILA